MLTFSGSLIALIATSSWLGLQAAALGINCRGSGACPLASFENSNADSLMEVLRDVILASPLDNSTTYNSGDHITCVAEGTKINVSLGASAPVGETGGTVSGTVSFGGTAHTGGICLFPQNVKTPLTLGSAKDLVDAVITHGCTTCGSVPVNFVSQGSNDPSDGILTFNFVGDPDCIGNCIDASAPSTASAAPSAAPAARRRRST